MIEIPDSSFKFVSEECKVMIVAIFQIKHCYFKFRHLDLMKHKQYQCYIQPFTSFNFLKLGGK